jgi:hypothetical protein
MGYQPTSPASQPRLRVTWEFHFEADEFADHAHHFTLLPMDVWRDNRGRWSVSPKEV